MGDTPFMPLWVADFLGDTLDLDAKELGAYMLILMTLWQRNGVLSDDQKKLKRVSRIGRDWPKVWAEIGRYFIHENGTITNKRLTQELQKVAAKRAANAQSGARGGRAKALKYKERALANATISPKQPEPYPEREEKREAKASPKKRATSMPENAVISDRQIEIASEHSHGPDEARLQFERFKGSAIAKGRTYASWNAAWSNWFRSEFFKPITNQITEINGGPHGTSPSTANPNADPTAHAIAIAGSLRRSQEKSSFGG